MVSMRFKYVVCLFVVLIIVLSAFGSERQGTFTDSAGDKHSWTINFARSLIWDNMPYVPVGIWLRITDPIDEARYTEIKQTGLSDVILEMPLAPGEMSNLAWQASINLCEKQGFKYMLAMGADPPLTSGYQVTPQSYRVPNVSDAGVQNIRIPKADSAIFALVDKTDATVVQFGKVTPTDGLFRIQLHPRDSGAYVLLIYPHFPQGLLPDYWEKYDIQRDNLLSTLLSLKFGKGFRGFLDPLGRRVKWMDPERDFVPDSKLFRSEFERALRKNYSSIGKLNAAWGLTEYDLPSYEIAARVMPMFSRGRGTNILWDSQNDKLYKVEIGKCKYWHDIQEIIRGASARRARNLASAVKKVVDVPVIYTWTGWSNVFEPQDAASDGIGMLCRGIGASVIENSAAYVLSAIFDWSPSGWLLASDMMASSNGKTDYTDENSMHLTLDWAKSLGAKGIFVRTGSSKETLTWLSNYAQITARDNNLSTTQPLGVFFPETARVPAEIMRLSSTVWWLPSSAAGDRVDFGADFDAYWISRPNGTFIYVWSHGEERDLTLRLIDPKNVSVLTFDGLPVETKNKGNKLSFRVGPKPVLVGGLTDIPVPVEAENQVIDEFDRLLNLSQKYKMDITDLKSAMREGEELAKSSPGAGYAQMREVVNKASSRLASYAWVEAEITRDHTFGDSPITPGASGQRVLKISTSIEPPGGTYLARYNIQLPVEGEYTLWIAGVPPGENNASPIEWIVDSTPVGKVAKAEVEARYGGKYGWYSLGKIRLTSGNHALVIKVQPNTLGEFEANLDVLLLTPNPFIPDGLRHPPVQ
jgi:hypothetical protein